MARRGIVITPQFDFDGQTLRLKGGFDPASLRQYLLYWDKIDWPDNNIISIGESDDDGTAFLISTGILERTMVRFNSFNGNIGHAMLDMQVSALEMRNESEPGAWSLAQQSTHLASTATGRAIKADCKEIKAIIFLVFLIIFLNFFSPPHWDPAGILNVVSRSTPKKVCTNFIIAKEPRITTIPISPQ